MRVRVVIVGVIALLVLIASQSSVTIVAAQNDALVVGWEALNIPGWQAMVKRDPFTDEYESGAAFGDGISVLCDLMHPLILEHQITPKTSRYTRCSMSMLPNVSINGRIRSSGQLGRWWYSISPCRNSECVRRFTVFAFNQRS